MTQLWRITVTIPDTLAEDVADFLGANALALSTMHPPRTEACLIEAIVNQEPDRASLTARLAVVAALHGMQPPDLTIDAIPQIDWLARTARAFPPITAGRLIVHGAHDRGKIPVFRPSLQIEAATAFGTGEHPTTLGCLLMLDAVLKSRTPRRALDMGCGSGILALALARLAHVPSVAVDIDPESVRMARLNAKINNLTGYVRVGQSDGYRAPLVGRGAPYDLIFANIFARPLALLAKDLRRHLAPGGVAILSGLLNTQENMVLAAHRLQRLHLWRRLRLGEWSVLVVRKKNRPL